ncbi:monovalent cation/H(+) antiporter subunit G [Roseinatronobacter alkalisoli]|uniref:Monovalent cation/H(+) antiporter subunit G n=1 Tax=Roseinatronobacter alkalisoli TaxID=3028235 RepID=A0ABT5T8K3_9RHOB|nr:monovalent cation/H(+) antiporter subunit G [Roseinatronobacter sp. HJB301]MDD7971456.1 monovalent cation/H(+) antiporter subunit G [Roseinatronobacter sp. HJB301]
MIDILKALLVLGGGAFVLIAAIGIVRLPDLLTRMHASTKAGTLGSLLILAALAIHIGTVSGTSKVLATVLFLLLTAPIAAHMIGRAYARTNVRNDKSAKD